MTQAGDTRSEPGHRRQDGGANGLLTAMLEEKPIWAGLYEQVRDALFAAKLPPLELTSRPVPVVDRMALKTNPWAVGTSTVVNSGIVAALLCLGLGAVFHHGPKPVSDAHLDLSNMSIFAPTSAKPAGGGGGGGSHDLIAPVDGRLPRFEATPLLPPQVPLLEQPKLAVDSAVSVQPDIHLPDNQAMPNIGVYESPNVRLASNGTGGPVGMGTGLNGGAGPGSGPGYGPGRDGGYGGQIYTPGVGGVTAPVALLTPEAEFSDQARRQKYQGVCVLAVIVDAHGMPQNPRVIQHLGMGLDEKAVDAVLRYRFKPAKKNGQPVPVAITVVVNFRLLF